MSKTRTSPTPQLTKQAITRLNTAPVAVQVVNGCFNIVTVIAAFSRYRVELRVEVTHPALAWQCGDRNFVELIYWKGCDGEWLELPSELEVLVERLKVAGAMSDEQARNLSGENASAGQLGF